jgi:hypothetical protein
MARFCLLLHKIFDSVDSAIEGANQLACFHLPLNPLKNAPVFATGSCIKKEKEILKIMMGGFALSYVFII